MPRLSRAFFAVLFLAACTQPQAQVDLKGNGSYARGTNGAANPAYKANVPQATEQAAPAQSIGVNDLAPPSDGKPHSALEDKAPPPVQTAQAAPAVEVKPLPAPAPAVAEAAPPVVNPWTHKSRSEEEMDAQLDKVANNDAAPPKPAAAKTAFIWPVSERKVISGFGPKEDGQVNDGIDIAAKSGEPVAAAADGEVIYVGNDLKDYGTMVVIKHVAGKSTAYAHLSRANVDKYDRVKQGDVIGYVGATGNVKSPQLHFAIREGKTPVDPGKYLNG